MADRTYFIAEAGVNHNGSVDIARRLVDVAAEAGCDAVKFQLFQARQVVAGGASRAPYQGDGSQESLLEGLELSRDHVASLAEHAAGARLDFVCSPFDIDSAKFLADLGVPLMKVSSGEITNLRFLRDLGRLGVPIVLSTGTATLGEVEAAVGMVLDGLAAAPSRAGRRDGPFEGGLVLLHCVTAYPAPVEQTNLRAMQKLAAAFGYPVGYSDHTIGAETAIAAVAMGARIIEKHFTLDNAMEGPDHAASASPQGLAQVVASVRLTASALGDGRKGPAACELENLSVVRRRLCAARDIPAGAVLADDDLLCLRAAAGVPAEHFSLVAGRAARRNLARREPITWEDV